MEEGVGLFLLGILDWRLGRWAFGKEDWGARSVFRKTTFEIIGHRNID